MIVKGDGTLMPEELARIKPIETILSGPAASVIGGAFLTERQDGFILDMGGTTTDIAYIQQGIVKIKEEGAKVGGWRTRVRAAELSTFGLGGDSHIYLNTGGQVEIGPEKAIPLSLMGKSYPYLVSEMRNFRRHGEYQTYAPYEADCYFLHKISSDPVLTEKEKKIVEVLRDGPHSISHIGKCIEEDPATLDLLPLIKQGLVGRISVTPTDILHVQGKYTEWDEEIARVGVEILATRSAISVENFLEKVELLMSKKLCMTVLQSICDFEGETLDLTQSKEAMHFIEKVITGKGNTLLKVAMDMQKPIIAIGAPVAAWVEPLRKRLNCQVMIPQHGEVANAIGAAVGQVMEEVEMHISVDEKINQYILNTPWERNVYKTMEEALFYAVHLGRKHIEKILFKAGCGRYEIVESMEDSMVDLGENGSKIFMGKKIKITGVGKLS